MLRTSTAGSQAQISDIVGGNCMKYNGPRFKAEFGAGAIPTIYQASSARSKAHAGQVPFQWE